MGTFIAVTFAGSPPHAEHFSTTDANILLGSLQMGVKDLKSKFPYATRT